MSFPIHSVESVIIDLDVEIPHACFQLIEKNTSKNIVLIVEDALPIEESAVSIINLLSNELLKIPYE